MRVIYTQPNGVVAIVIPSADFVAQFAEEFTLINGLVEKFVPPDTEYRVIRDDSEIPTDRTFRNAWTMDLTVDMDKAREIHMDRIRVVRDEELKRLDIETLKGVDVQKEKQALRDIPQTFDLDKAETPDELKALWPKELPNA